MKIKFTESRDTIGYGIVKSGDVVTCKKKDALAFIKNGLAVAADKEDKDNG